MSEQQRIKAGDVGRLEDTLNPKDPLLAAPPSLAAQLRALTFEVSSQNVRHAMVQAADALEDHRGAIEALQQLLARLQANRGGTLTGGVALAIEVLQGNKHGW